MMSGALSVWLYRCNDQLRSPVLIKCLMNVHVPQTLTGIIMCIVKTRLVYFPSVPGGHCSSLSIVQTKRCTLQI